MLLNGPIVDRADAAALTSPVGTPADLPQAGPARNQLPLLRAEQERELERPVLFLVEKPADTGCEYRVSTKSKAQSTPMVYRAPEPDVR